MNVLAFFRLDLSSNITDYIIPRYRMGEARSGWHFHFQLDPPGSFQAVWNGAGEVIVLCIWFGQAFRDPRVNGGWQWLDVLH